MATEQSDHAEIRFNGLTRKDIESLRSFFKAQPEIVAVSSRVLAMDAAYDPSSHHTVAVIVGFSVGVGGAVGRKALDIAADLVRDWVKKRQSQSANEEMHVIYGPDEQVVKLIRRSRRAKPK
jgi:hypothetical protein